MTYEEIERLCEIPPADWAPHFGNNHIVLPPVDVLCGGMVDIASHIGKPLSQRLWEDLRHRMCVTRICIYLDDQEQWCLGWPPGTALIECDVDGLVTSIKFNPVRQCFREHVEKLNAFSIYTRAGSAIGNLAAIERVQFE